MRNPIRLFLHNMLRYNCRYIVFFSSLIFVTIVHADSLIVTISEEELKQLELLEQQVKNQFNSYIIKDNTTSYSLNTRSTLESTSTPLQEQTYIDYQTAWNDFYTDAFYSGTDSYFYKLYSQGIGQGRIFNNFYHVLTAQTNLITNLPYAFYPYFLSVTNQLDNVIGKLDRLASSDSDVNVNVNVNLQPIQQVLTDIKDNVEISRQRLSEIEQETFHISENTDVIKMASGQIAEEIISFNETVTSSFNESNRVLNHIDDDLHQLQLDGIPIDFDSANFDSAIGKHIDQLTENMQSIADEKTERTKLDDDLMEEAFNEQQGANYVLAPLTGAQAQLESELSTIQYTNINLNSYNYEEYNNYFTLQGYADDPPSNDEFIRQKIQDYIDQVYYSTENVKGQIVSRLDELKQSTLLTTNYKPEWLVVKRGALSQEWNFPKTDWKVDFSDIKVDSEITKTIYDVIYYVLAIVIIYKQFSKVV